MGCCGNHQHGHQHGQQHGHHTDNPIVELLRQRRSSRKFTEQAIEIEKINQVLEAALLSPTSRNRRPWQFVVVTDKEVLAGLADCKAHGAAFTKDAPCAVVVLGDEQKCDVWVEDTAIATINMQLAAEAAGLGSCWVQIRERAQENGTSAEAVVRSLLDVSPELRVLSLVVLGYPAQKRPAYTDEDIDWTKVYMQKYGKKYKG